MPRKVLAVDLDGTLAMGEHGVSPANRMALQRWRAAGNSAVIVTGRAWAGVLGMIEAEFPIDALIFSSGAGVIDWPTQQLLFSRNLEQEQVTVGAKALCEMELDFMMLEPVGPNHFFYYWKASADNPDFDRRVAKHLCGCAPLTPGALTRGARQFLVIVPPLRVREVEKLLRLRLPQFSLIRATSPLDHQSGWFELFHAGVSKGQTTKWWATRLGIAADGVVAIGNDYNDIDLLSWAKRAFVVPGSPADLIARFALVPGAPQCAVATAIEMLLAE